MNKRHIQVPNDTCNLNNVDLVVYAAIKSFKIKNNPCFPSQETIANKLKLTRPTIKKSIDKLVSEGYITTKKKGKLTLYEFSKYKKFEIFSNDFLDNGDLDSKIKGYIIGTQQLMFKDIEGIGKTTVTTKQLANKINISEKTIKRYDKELVDKGLLVLAKTSVKDPLTGINQVERIFNLEKLGQAIIWKLKEHDDKINENSNAIEQLQKDNELLKRQLQILMNQFNTPPIEEELKL